MEYLHLITIEAGKRGGKPCIRGLRITVSDVLDYLASGMSEDEVLRDFSDLTREDIRACFAFAADRERRLMGRITGSIRGASRSSRRAVWSQTRTVVAYQLIALGSPI